MFKHKEHFHPHTVFMIFKAGVKLVKLFIKPAHSVIKKASPNQNIGNLTN